MKRTLLIGVIAVALVLGVAAYATAETGTVTVTATVNPKITLSIDDSALALGGMDPDASGSANAVLTVSSNKAFTINRAAESNYVEPAGASPASLAEAIGLSISPSGWTLGASNAKGKDLTFTDVYSYSIPWTSEPGDYSADFVYTVVQP